MYINDKILIGKTDDLKDAAILPFMINRHGIITGASGSGKTTTLKVMAESFSSCGIPSILIDVKGDLKGCAVKGDYTKVEKRVNDLQIENFEMQSFPVEFWDIYGKYGNRIRCKINDLGARMLSKMLLLSDSQEEVLTLIFKIAEDEQLEIIDLEDLKEVTSYVYDNRLNYSKTYGNISAQTITTIQRSILTLKENGGDMLFGRPEFDLKDFMKYSPDNGYGNINILDATTLFKNPRLYAIFILWLLSELYDKLDEIGDAPKPRLVFFIDEAHLLFSEIDERQVKQIVQIVKLIRSKGVGLYFISQSPSDIKEEILGQLGNKIQHTLRSYTKSDEKSLKAAAASFRINKEFDNEEVIKNLGTGEALVSFLNEKAEPSISLKVKILPPQSKIGTVTPQECQDFVRKSRFFEKYEKEIESETAKDVLKREKEAKEENIKNEESVKKLSSIKKSTKGKTSAKDRVINSALNTIGRKIGNSIFKGIFRS